MLSLALDHQGVLRAWEEIGGNVYSASCPEVPDAFNLDLSNVEAKLRAYSGNAYLTCQSGLCGPSAQQFFLDDFLGCPPSFAGDLFPSFDQPDNAWKVPMGFGPPPIMPFNSFQKVPDGGKPEIKQEEPCEFGPTQSPSSSSSQEVATVPDLASASSVQVASPGNNSSCASLLASTSGAGLLASMPSQLAAVRNTDIEVRTRKECLERYREKKARRLYTKKIRYQLRKINADKRPRIKGRFVKKEELDEYLKQSIVPSNGSESCSDDEYNAQMDDEDGASDQE